MRRRLRLLAVLLVLGAPGGASADEPQARARSFGVRDTTRGRFAVEETRRLLATGDVDRALAQAQDGIEEHADDLFLEQQAAGSERWRPVGVLLEELLRGLPPETRARYDALVAAAVEPLRARALASGDVAALETLRRRFGASRFGLEATRLLLERAVEAGELRRAALLAREVSQREPREAAAWWRWMEALAALGDGAALSCLDPAPDLTLETGRGPLALGPRLAALRAGLPSEAAATTWPMWGGAPDRLRVVPAAAGRNVGLRWSLETTLGPREQDLPGRDADGDDQADFVNHLDAYRPMFPACDGRTLYVSDGRALRAVDLFGGRVLWRLEEAQPGLALLSPGSLALGRTALDRPFAPVLWRDRLIATLEVYQSWREDRVLGTQVNSYMPRRALVAVARQDGRLLWRAGAAEADRARMKSVHICSEPVVLDDVVVALGARYQDYEDVALFGFDAADGRVLWETPLVYGQQETNLFGKTVKEFSAGAVSGRDGVAYAGTGLGCLAAVRVADGQLLWLASYDIIPIEPVQMWFQPKIRLPRVGPAAPLVTPDLVISAPGDALHVNAYDRATGALRWRAPFDSMLRTRYGTLRQVLGVASIGGRDALLLTSSTVDALDLGSGRLLARGRLDPEGSQVRGQGVLRGREVLVPTEEGLQRFSLDGELKLLGRESWSEGAVSGNLLALGHVLVVAGRGEIQAHYAWEDVQRDIAQRRRERPDDPEVLLEAGDIYLRGRGPSEARAAFRAALDLAPPGSPVAERARRGLFDAWMAEGRERAQGDPVRGAPAWREALALAVTPAERIDARLALDAGLTGRHDERVLNLERLYVEAGEEGVALNQDGASLPVRALTLLRLATLEEEARRPLQAVAALQRLLETHGDVRLGIEDARAMAQRRIGLVLARSGPEAYAPFEARARAALEEARARRDAAALERVLVTWPNASVVPATRLALGQALLEQGRAEESAAQLRALRAALPESTESVPALLPLARAYAALGASGARRATLAALAEQAPTLQVERDGRRLPAPEAAQLEAGPSAAPAVPASFGPPLVERLVDPPADEELTVPVGVVCEPGTLAPIALTVRARTLRGYDLRDGRRAFELPDVPSARAAWGEDTLVIAQGGELRGMDPADGATRWRRELGLSVNDLAVTRGVLAVYGQDLAGPRGEQRLSTFDLRTGLPLWSAALGPEPVFAISGLGPHVVLSRLLADARGQRTRLLVFDLLSGAALREIDLPATRDLRDVLLPGLVLGAGAADGRRGRRVSAIELGTGRTRWSVPLESEVPVGTLVPDGDNVWALQQDGSLTCLALADGAQRARTRVETGEARALPAHGTVASVLDGRLTLLAAGARQGSPLLCFDVGSGKLRWAVEAEPLTSTQMHALTAIGEHWVVLLAGRDAAGARRTLVRVIRRADGVVEQEIEPGAGGANSMVTVAVGPRALVVLTGAGTALYVTGTAAR